MINFLQKKQKKMYFKKAIEYLVYMFCLFFLFGCSTLDDDVLIEKTPKEITIFSYPSNSKVNCSETLDVNCKDNSSSIKKEMQNKSNEKINNKGIKSNTASSSLMKRNLIYKERAEKHCKKYDKKAQLANRGLNKTEYYGTRYLEKYFCI
jgi:hypothetical protein